MANTFTQIYIQSVFAVKGRESIISKSWKDELYKYITGIVQNNGHKLLAIGGMPDHIHIFYGMKPIQSISDLMQDVKGCSSKWINEKKFVKGKFQWQAGYGAFSYAHSQLDTVINYIRRQEEHHKKQSFKTEYQELLTKFNIEFDQHYTLNEIEELYRP
ncbi:MAG: IS200/IS605 family transposase [Bacteroidetes bacterium]|jgi:REP element-mobilizing transposase RayT|nr:IS200/IS605 family transposase [Bacteroidota bacterium]MBT5529878.1 IS200/IS605 family transposase [Cytophagia bacterium]MBT4339292.1 IS200/IS605 family transposase [Bacteroidota bacterium]MBT4728923.1 IS200/IS605 family transposase [Bacteroidota bacterium]MBT4969832.1 IS200/IS605 family transposase [Bacteroidota bacterium]